jgi:hypothetical protein
VPEAARKAAGASSMKGNPVSLDLNLLEGILYRAMDG